MAGFALQNEVGHELHLDLDGAFALTLFATSAVGIEAEVGGSEFELLGKGLLGHQATYFVVGLHVGDGVGARAFADRVLVDELYALYGLEVAAEFGELARAVGHEVEVAPQGII